MKRGLIATKMRRARRNLKDFFVPFVFLMVGSLRLNTSG
jgi:hypothetical protein